jgi:SsrA-binding protein
MRKIVNKNAYREYEIEDKVEAGIVLTGAEAKAIRTRGIQLKDAFVKIISGQPYLINAVIHPYPFARSENQEMDRKRKLLLKENEIKKLIEKKGQKLTIVPLACYTKGRWIKLLLGIGKRKTKHQKKRDLIEKEIDKNIQKFKYSNIQKEN